MALFVPMSAGAQVIIEMGFDGRYTSNRLWFTFDTPPFGLVELQGLADGVSQRLRDKVESVWLWVAVGWVILMSVAFKHRKFIRTEIRIWRLRRVGRSRSSVALAVGSGRNAATSSCASL